MLQGFCGGSGAGSAGWPLWEEMWDSPILGTAGSYLLHSGDIAATAKPFGKAGGASVKAELRKGRKCCAREEVGTETVRK